MSGRSRRAKSAGKHGEATSQSEEGTGSSARRFSSARDLRMPGQSIPGMSVKREAQGRGKGESRHCSLELKKRRRLDNAMKFKESAAKGASQARVQEILHNRPSEDLKACCGTEYDAEVEAAAGA